MSGLFGSGPSAPPTPPPPPTAANSQAQMDAAAQEQALRLQRGASAVMLTGGAGVPNPGSTSKVLLGS